MFEVALAKVKTKKDMIKILALINTIDVKDIPNVTYYQTNNLELEFLNPPKSSWCIDGEELKSTEMKYVFKVVKDMKMLVPQENINKLFEE